MIDRISRCVMSVGCCVAASIFTGTLVTVGDHPVGALLFSATVAACIGAGLVAYAEGDKK